MVGLDPRYDTINKVHVVHHMLVIVVELSTHDCNTPIKSSRMIEIGREKVKAEGFQRRVRLHLGDAMDLNVADGTYDKVVLLVACYLHVCHFI